MATLDAEPEADEMRAGNELSAHGNTGNKRMQFACRNRLEPNDATLQRDIPPKIAHELQYSTAQYSQCSAVQCTSTVEA